MQITDKNNYILGNGVFILNGFSSDTTNAMLGELANLVNSLTPCPQISAKYKITSPYELPSADTPVIDVYINSNGGEASILNSILTLLNIAKHRGAIIRTTVLGKAYSCGSLLAIHGTPGYRIMSHDAEHLVHFGRSNTCVTNETEIPGALKRMQQHETSGKEMYLANTKITKEKLQALYKNDYGFVNATNALKWGFCDWVLGPSGILTPRRTR